MDHNQEHIKTGFSGRVTFGQREFNGNLGWVQMSKDANLTSETGSSLSLHARRFNFIIHHRDVAKSN